MSSNEAACSESAELLHIKREKNMAKKWKPESELAKVVYAAGFEYNPDQDIIYSRMNAWQRYFG